MWVRAPIHKAVQPLTLGYSKKLEQILKHAVVLATLRHQVQLAAEQAFPWRTAGVATTRQAFLLPGDGSLPG